MTDVEFIDFDDAGILTYKVMFKRNHVGDVFEDMGWWWYRTPYAMMSWRTTDMDAGAQELIAISGIK